MGKEHFKVNTPQLLKEIADCGLDRKQGVLKVPLNILRTYLCKVAERAIELDDPLLNELMCDMVLYELPDPRTEEYHDIITKVRERAKNFREEQSLPELEH